MGGTCFETKAGSVHALSCIAFHKPNESNQAVTSPSPAPCWPRRKVPDLTRFFSLTLSCVAHSRGSVQCCFTSTETARTIREGEPRTATSTFTHSSWAQRVRESNKTLTTVYSTALGKASITKLRLHDDHRGPCLDHKNHSLDTNVKPRILLEALSEFQRGLCCPS